MTSVPDTATRSNWHFLFVLLLVLCPLRVSAQESDGKEAREEKQSNRFQQPIEEFFLTDSLHPPEEAGEFELHLVTGSWQQFTNNKALLSAEYAVAERLQIEVASPYWVGTSHWSLADFRGTALYTLLPNNRPFALGVQLEVGATDRETGQARSFEGVPSLLAARAFGRFQIHTQLGASLSLNRPSYIYNLATVYDAGRFTPTLEFNGVTSSDNPAFLITPGLYYHFTKRIEFGVGAPIHVYRGSDVPQVIGILTIVF